MLILISVLLFKLYKNYIIKKKVFPGTLDHLSLPNYSTKSRHTFQLHLVEGPKNGVTWSKGNWLQYPKGTEFHELPVKTGA